jgi:TonB family protein
MTLRRALPALLIAAAAACSTPAPEPAPPAAAPPPEPPSIETTSVATATATPQPTSDPAPSAGVPIAALPLSLSMMQVEKTLSHHRRHFNRLYVERVRVRPKLRGRMIVSFLINPDGTTANATVVESNLGDPTFEQMVLKQIGQTSFPPATGATPVNRYPLDFSLQPK